MSKCCCFPANCHKEPFVCCSFCKKTTCEQRCMDDLKKCRYYIEEIIEEEKKDDEKVKERKRVRKKRD